jgi:hypothetical protein
MKKFIIILASLLFSINVWAENSTRVGDYVIHHNATTTDMLDRKVARAYDIQRSKSRGLINIAVRKLAEDGVGSQAVAGQIKLIARSLTGHIQRDIPMREVREDGGKAIYYIADFPVADRDHLLFDVEFVPTETFYPLNAWFEQKFYTR